MTSTSRRQDKPPGGVAGAAGRGGVVGGVCGLGGPQGPVTVAGLTADPNSSTRVVMQFPEKAEDMLLSGTLERGDLLRSEKHTSELQSRGLSSYAGSCLTK